MKLLELPSFFKIVCDCGDWFIDPSWVLHAFCHPLMGLNVITVEFSQTFSPRRGKACLSGDPV